ncbi:hypothetical protein LTV02_14195 [Nocardia yamanashiensis]|uniref:hypothetical protein n=1 Tax=Nocardia yamanashiensis TaxID=209247 RepID=UPI001E62637D|nr:hypothetical protein [Nocardia yamanashiensis]UGT44465.1 hypothetical protein LTV02_14195 [Nocardia yamanashiensis]
MRGVGIAAMAGTVAAAAMVGVAGNSVAKGADGAAADGCVAERSAVVSSGTEPGGTSSGPDAIFAFEYAYYVLRSGVAARAVVAADSVNVAPAEWIQDGIDQHPSGSRYCVRIAPIRSGGGSEVWDVMVTQQYPDGRVTEYAQEITTRRGETGHLITRVDSK